MGLRYFWGAGHHLPREDTSGPATVQPIGGQYGVDVQIFCPGTDTLPQSVLQKVPRRLVGHEKVYVQRLQGRTQVQPSVQILDSPPLLPDGDQAWSQTEALALVLPAGPVDSLDMEGVLMTTGEMIALICGLGVPMVGGFGWLGYQLGQIKAKMVTQEDIDRHQDRCPAYREMEPSAVRTMPPLPPGG